MNKSLKVANFIVNYFNQQKQLITAPKLGNLMYLIAGNYYLKHQQLLLDESFYRLGIGYQLPAVTNNFHQTKGLNLQPTSKSFSFSSKQQNYIMKQLVAYDSQSYNQLAYQCSLLKKRLLQSKLDLNNFENKKV